MASLKSSPPSSPYAPMRFIYNESDMDQFRGSPARRELLSFATALGKSCTPKGPDADGDDVETYDPENPLAGLSPAMASLHGSLRAMAELWAKEIPPEKVRARFGNPAFRKWHGRVVERSPAIVNSILDHHKRYVKVESRGVTAAMLDAASESGYRAAAGESETVSKEASQTGTSTAKAEPKNADGKDKGEGDREKIVAELNAYLDSSFGHPIRIDYGTGHESSFLVFLYSLFRIGCFGVGGDSGSSPASFRPVALSVFSQYLEVTRSVQTVYILEPAGTHGVWGLDDYHCLPFYFGACQLTHNSDGLSPSSIHEDRLLEEFHKRYMYFGCIRYIKSLKKGVPFFESSPMLNDISSLPTWSKVSSGLLRLYEGEVLDKLPVVQHFVFGNIFKATWTPSQAPPTAPSRTFINGPGGDECIAPWAENSPVREVTGGSPELPPPTRAPWAK